MEIRVEYRDLDQLFTNIQSGAFETTLAQNCNFVLIDERHYQGRYGGVFHKTELPALKKFPMEYDTILNEYIVVWWTIPTVKITGDLSLSYKWFYAVPVKIYRKMRPTLTPSPNHYYAFNTSRINSRSFENSPSE
jgi:hypothetical protein